MAKKSMQLKYKSPKRERNKKNEVLTNQDSVKGFLKTFIGVLVFLGVMYLFVFGMQKLGVFERGYEAPKKEATTFDYEYIPVGTVFNRNEKTYYVLFDDFSSDFTKDLYIESLLKNSRTPVYKVDMSIKENAKVKSDKANKNAKNASELKINDITLLKISNGAISEYIIGSEKIEEFLK